MICTSDIRNTNQNRKERNRSNCELCKLWNAMSNRLPDNPSLDEVIACQFSSWYPTFSGSNKASKCRLWNDARKCVTIKSLIIQKLSSDFISYLLSDGMTLPEGATKVSSFIPADTEIDDSWTSSSDCDQEDEEPDRKSEEKFNLSELTERICQAISSLGGVVTPKLNWSAPRDASWINNGTLRCETPGDVYLLIKSSDFCMHDISYVLKTAEHAFDHELVLRKWCNFWPSMEFRCFVADTKIVGICQRNHCEFYGYLNNDRFKIRSTIMNFFDDVVKNNFTAIRYYVIDVYVDRNDVVWLIDFNIWGLWTEPLLYTWDELSDLSLLCSNDGDVPELRIVENDAVIIGNPLSSYKAPIDTVDLATRESTSFHEFMQMCQKPSKLADDSE